MLKKLAEKIGELYKISWSFLDRAGHVSRKKMIVRKHRLWEVFLVEN
jgi:Mn-dependent DtxR family transcriptional regulator